MFLPPDDTELSPELEEFLKETPEEVAEGLAMQRRLTTIYEDVRRRHGWLAGFFRKVCWNAAEVEELIADTLAKYMRDVHVTLFATGGRDSSHEDIVEDGELIALVLTGVSTPIKNIEAYTYLYPDACFREIASNVRTDYIKNSVRRKEAAEAIRRHATIRQNRKVHGQYLSWSAEQWYSGSRRRDIESWLVRLAENREIRRRYLQALQSLGPVRRAAWILCHDDLLLPRDANQLLAPTLDGRKARGALARPLSGAAASRLLDRKDVSADVSKARTQLAAELEDLNPFRAWSILPTQWPREFLVGFPRCGGTRAVRRSAFADIDKKLTCDRDKMFIQRMPRQQAGNDILGYAPLRMLGPRSLDVVPGWAATPQPDDPKHKALVKRVHDLWQANNSWEMIAKELNAAGVPSRFGRCWHATGVSLFARRTRVPEKREKAKKK